MNQPVYDAAFFERIRKELTDVSNEMHASVNDYVNMAISRSEFHSRIVALSNRLDKARWEEEQMLKSYGRIISEIEKRQR